MVLPSACLRGEVGGGVGVVGAFGDGEAVEGAVELAVAAAVEAMAVGAARGGGDRGGSRRVRASFASVAKRSTPAISPISFAAVSGAAAALGEQLRRVALDERGELCLEFADPAGARGDLAQRSSRATRTRVVCCGAREAAGDRPQPLVGVQRAGRDLELGPEVVQMPAQPLLVAGAGRDQILAMVDEQTDVERGAVQVRAG